MKSEQAVLPNPCLEEEEEEVYKNICSIFHASDIVRKDVHFVPKRSFLSLISGLIF
jgi:hypothetical protein